MYWFPDFLNTALVEDSADVLQDYFNGTSELTKS